MHPRVPDQLFIMKKTLLKHILISIILLCFIGCGSKRDENTERAADRAKAFFLGVYECDLEKIKANSTEDFYQKYCLYDDDTMMENLSSVPEERRKESIDQIKNHTTYEALMNSAGDVVTIVFHNKKTGKEITVQLVDPRGNGDWKVSDYDY